MARECALHELLGRELLGANHQRVGLIEEFRTDSDAEGRVVSRVVIGLAGLLERLDVVRISLFGGDRDGYVARWDQIDISNPKQPRLICSIDELERL